MNEGWEGGDRAWSWGGRSRKEGGKQGVGSASSGSGLGTAVAQPWVTGPGAGPMGVSLGTPWSSVLPKSRWVVRLGAGQRGPGARERGCHGTAWPQPRKGEGSALTGQGRIEQSQVGRAGHGGSPLGSALPSTTGIQALGTRDSTEGCSGPRLQNTPQLPPSPCPWLGQARMSPSSLGQTPACPSSTWAELTAACRWRACGSCCWRSRPCGRGWRRRWPGARPWPWRSAAPAPSRSCTRPWAAPCRGSARSARPPPQAPVLQGNGHSEGWQQTLKEQPLPSDPGWILLLREI